jgi:hypothetical protein
MAKIIEINRAQIMDDALALARATLLDYNTALSTTEYLDAETHFTPWNAAMSALSYIYDRLAYVKDSRQYFEVINNTNVIFFFAKLLIITTKIQAG